MYTDACSRRLVCDPSRLTWLGLGLASTEVTLINTALVQMSALIAARRNRCLKSQDLTLPWYACAPALAFSTI